MCEGSAVAGWMPNRRGKITPYWMTHQRRLDRLGGTARLRSCCQGGLDLRRIDLYHTAGIAVTGHKTLWGYCSKGVLKTAQSTS